VVLEHTAVSSLRRLYLIVEKAEMNLLIAVTKPGVPLMLPLVPTDALILTAAQLALLVAAVLARRAAPHVSPTIIKRIAVNVIDLL